MTHDMSCVACRDLLPWYVAGTLPASERERIDQHLATCEACRAELPLWRDVGLSLQRADRAVSPELSIDPAWQTLSAQLFPKLRLEEKIMQETPMAPVDPTPRRERTRVAMKQPQPDVAPRARRTALLLPVAALLFVLIGAVVLAVLRPHQTTIIASSPTMTLPHGTEITAVDMLTPRNIWAVGYVATSSSDVATPTALILHYTGGHWVTVGNGDFPASMLNAVAMSGPDEGWAVGSTGLTTTSTDIYQPLLLHYKQGQWTKVPVPSSVPPAINGQLSSIDIVATDSIWFTGNGTFNQGTADQGTAYRALLWHYAHGTWSSTETPAQSKQIDMVADDEGWAIGASTIWHYQHGQWSAQNINTAIALYNLAMTSSQSGWASGYYQSPTTTGKRLSGQGNARSALLHYDGKSWSLVELPTAVLAADTEGVAPFFMQSDQDGWGIVKVLSSNDSTKRYVLRYHSGQWTREYIGVGALRIAGMLLTSAEEGWAVTESFDVSPHGTDQISILRYSDGIWSTNTNP